VVRPHSQRTFARPLDKLHSDLPVLDSNPLVARQLIQAYRAVRADFVSAHDDFCAHAEFAAVGEPGMTSDGNGLLAGLTVFLLYYQKTRLTLKMVVHAASR
jgi:hypothetical protein